MDGVFLVFPKALDFDPLDRDNAQKNTVVRQAWECVTRQGVCAARSESWGKFEVEDVGTVISLYAAIRRLSKRPVGGDNSEYGGYKIGLDLL